MVYLRCDRSHPVCGGGSNIMADQGIDEGVKQWSPTRSSPAATKLQHCSCQGMLGVVVLFESHRLTTTDVDHHHAHINAAQQDITCCFPSAFNGCLCNDAVTGLGLHW